MASTLLLALLAPISCSPAEPSLAGIWRGDRPFDPELKDQPLARTVAKIELKLEDNGEFTLTDGGLPFAGQWKRDGLQVALLIDTVLNQPIGRQAPEMRDATGAYSCTVQGEGLLFRDANGASVPLTRVPTVPQ